MMPHLGLVNLQASPLHGKLELRLLLGPFLDFLLDCLGLRDEESKGLGHVFPKGVGHLTFLGDEEVIPEGSLCLLQAPDQLVQVLCDFGVEVLTGIQCLVRLLPPRRRR